MATKKQIQANKNNAKKSTGPKTPEGKAKSAQNATTHGLTASTDVIKGESQEEFDAHKQAFLDVLNPQNAVEDFLADRVASLSWRLKRADRIERQMLDGFAADMQFLRRQRPPWDYPASSDDPDLTLGTAVRRDLDNDKTLDRFKLYERRIESSFFKSLNALNYRKPKTPTDTENTQPHAYSPSLSRPTSRDLNNPQMEPTRTHPPGTQQKNQTQLSIAETNATHASDHTYNLCPRGGGVRIKPNNTNSPASESAAGTSQDRRTTSKKVSTRRY